MHQAGDSALVYCLKELDYEKDVDKVLARHANLMIRSFCGCAMLLSWAGFSIKCSSLRNERIGSMSEIWNIDCRRMRRAGWKPGIALEVFALPPAQGSLFYPAR